MNSLKIETVSDESNYPLSFVKCGTIYLQTSEIRAYYIIYRLTYISFNNLYQII